MTRQQNEADVGERKPVLTCPPDDNRRPGKLHRTNGAERAHRDRGVAGSSDGWKNNVRQEKD